MFRPSLSLLLTAIVAATAPSPARASLYGTLTNFDVFNETETEVHGAEIELEGIHLEDLTRTFPAHFLNKDISEYAEGASFGVRVTYSDYSFNGANSLSPSVGTSTNGHSCVNTPGCEHLGFSTRGAQPTAANYYWHDVNGARIGIMPLQVPTPTWTYVAPVGGGNPILRAEVEPVEIIEQKPDSVWMKVFKAKFDRVIELDELMSANGIVPEGAEETETEWEILEGGKMNQKEDELDVGTKAIIRRYEYFEYTGPYDEEHEPTSLFLDTDLPGPPEGELGQFISANMVAANLVAPDRTRGDYNGDGVVDAADYTVWRDSHGSDEDHHADGNDDGMIDDDDLVVWRDRYGDDLNEPANAGNSQAPEPVSLALLLVCGAASMAGRPRPRLRYGSKITW